jgi:hypothetical protein
VYVVASTTCTPKWHMVMKDLLGETTPVIINLSDTVYICGMMGTVCYVHTTDRVMHGFFWLACPRCSPIHVCNL